MASPASAAFVTDEEVTAMTDMPDGVVRTDVKHLGRDDRTPAQFTGETVFAYASVVNFLFRNIHSLLTRLRGVTSDASQELDRFIRTAIFLESPKMVQEMQSKLEKFTTMVTSTFIVTTGLARFVFQCLSQWMTKDRTFRAEHPDANPAEVNEVQHDAYKKFTRDFVKFSMSLGVTPEDLDVARGVLDDATFKTKLAELLPSEELQAKFSTGITKAWASEKVQAMVAVLSATLTDSDKK